MAAEPDNDISPKAPRRVPALFVYLSPFRLVESSQLGGWNTTIDEVNNCGWDYIKLHEIAGGIDVGLSAPYHMLVGRDGVLALPPIPELRGDQKIVEFFNRCLAALLIGGIYCDAVVLYNLELGSVIDWKYLRTRGQGRAASNRFHFLIRQRQASPIDAIALLRPRTVTIETLQAAMSIGLSVLEEIPSLSGEFLLKGVSGIARRDWGAALSSLWIVVEQVTAYLWEREVLRRVMEAPNQIDGRRKQLRDTRTWTTANRQEVLHQKGVVDVDALRSLSLARKSRNDLVHSGSHPTEAAARACYAGAISLLRVAINGREIPLFVMDLNDHSMSDPFKPIDRGPLDPEYWMPIPKLPGEEELEREEIASRSAHQ